MTKQNKNPNYKQTGDGFVRIEGEPDAKHESRLKWSWVESFQKISQGVAELRAQQDQRNAEYKAKHGG